MTGAIGSDIERLASMREGVVLTSELRELGWTEPAIRRGVRSLTRLLRGAFTPALPDDPLARHRQLCLAVTATHPGLCMGYLSAAVLWQLPLLGPPPADAQVLPIGTRPHGWRAPSGIRHRGQTIPSERVAWVDGIPVTDVTRTVVDCSRVVPFDEAVVIADAAVHSARTDTRRMVGAIASMTGWKGIEGARRMLAQVDGRSESPGESLSRVTITSLGFEVTPQVEIFVDGVFVARVDLLVDDEFVVVEYDGRAKYEIDGTPSAALMAEKRRHDALVMAGYEVVRLTWPDLDDIGRIRHMLEQAIARSRFRRAGEASAF